MTTIITECAQAINCTTKNLRDFLNHPQDRDKVIKILVGRKVRTIYKDRNGFKKTFFIDGITKQGAHSLLAYGRLPRPFNICVAAHFYARHRLRLKYPYLPCIIEHFTSGEDRYYPMELLEFVDDKPGNFGEKGNKLWKIKEEDEEEEKEELVWLKKFYEKMKAWKLAHQDEEEEEDYDEIHENEEEEDNAAEDEIFLAARAECSQNEYGQFSSSSLLKKW